MTLYEINQEIAAIIDDLECIDHIARGAINEQPAWIGIGTYVSGVGEEYTELVPKYYKLTNDFTK